MAYIYSFVSEKNFFFSTGTTSEADLNILKNLLGKRKTIELIRDKQGLTWITVNKNNLEFAIPILTDYYGTLEVFKEVNELQVCTISCQDAKGDKCECSCMGQSHKGGEGLWKNPTGDLLIKNSKSTGHYIFTREEES